MRFGMGVVLAAGVLLPTRATAAPGEVMKACGAKYQAAKAAKSLAADETWKHFLATCRASTPKAAMTAAAPKSAAAQSGAQVAARERMKQCSGQWKVEKAAGKTGDQRWPAYWSACSVRLKAKG